MGFFSDLKDDLSQAVNELMPEDAEEGRDAGNAKEGSTDGNPGKKDTSPVKTGSETAVIDKETVEAELKDAAESGDKSETTEELTEMADLDSMLDRVESMNFPEPDTSSAIAPRAVGAGLSAKETDHAWGGKKEEKKHETAQENKSAYHMNSKSTNVVTTDSKKAEKKMETQMQARTAADETALITMGMTINGDITSEGSLEMTGTIIGNIDVLGKLNVTGKIQGNSKAAEIYADNAQITGEVNSVGSVKIGQSSVIIGNITATSAVIAGAVKGDIDVRGPVVLDTPAIVMGNIKSKTVQINNGAVIEGMCSQCYADVNPTSFFEDYKKGNKK